MAALYERPLPAKKVRLRYVRVGFGLPLPLAVTVVVSIFYFVDLISGRCKQTWASIEKQRQ